VTIPDTSESVLEFDYEQLLSKLTERVFVKVFDKDGLPCEYAEVWAESQSGTLMPASKDGYSNVFYLSDGEYIIHAEKNGEKGNRSYRIKTDVNNSGSGEIFETFVQIY
jgi:hypothetical protein